MKTIRLTRLTWIALSIAALLVVAIAPAASAACTGNACLNGTYALRLDPATGFDANLAVPLPTPAISDPGNVGTAPAQNVMQAGQFTANGSGGITAGKTLATIDDNSGNTDLIDFTWTGTYSLATDLTGSLTINPGGSSSWKCYNMTTSGGQAPWTASNTYYTPPLPAWPPPAQIRPTASNAGNLVFQPVAAPAWSASHLYPSSPASQINPTTSSNAFRRNSLDITWKASTAYAVNYEIMPYTSSSAANAICTAVGTPFYCCTGSGAGYCATINPGFYVFQVTADSSQSGISVPAFYNATAVGGTVTDNGVTWTNLGNIAGTSGTTQPTWPTGAAVPTVLSTSASTFTVDGGILWINEGPVGKSGTTQPSWSQVGQVTDDGGIVWTNVGTAPLTPIACTSTWESTETYSTSLSASHGALEMVETDNSTPPSSGAKIFMTGEAVKR